MSSAGSLLDDSHAGAYPAGRGTAMAGLAYYGRGCLSEGTGDAEL